MEIRKLNRQERDRLSATPCWYDVCDHAVTRQASDGRLFCTACAADALRFQRMVHREMDRRRR